MIAWFSNDHSSDHLTIFIEQERMSQVLLKLVLGINILQKWIMTDFQRTVTSCSLLANSVLLRAGRWSPLPSLCAWMWNSDQLMPDLFFHLLSTLKSKEVECARKSILSKITFGKISNFWQAIKNMSYYHFSFLLILEKHQTQNKKKGQFSA